MIRAGARELIIVLGLQAVVVSIDPRRVYIKDPSDVKFKAIKLANQGPNGEEFAWYQCTVFILSSFCVLNNKTYSPQVLTKC